jgi:hypothetical protein
MLHSALAFDSCDRGISTEFPQLVFGGTRFQVKLQGRENLECIGERPPQDISHSRGSRFG